MLRTQYSNFVTCSTVILAIITSCQLAFGATGTDGAKLTHPVHGHKANSFIDHLYGDGHGFPDSWNLGDITFPANYPPLSQLTEEEKYIIAGSRSSDWNADAGLFAWSGQVFSMVAKFYKQYGYVPEKLTPDVIRSIDGMQEFGDENMREFLNPLTDEWPSLNATSPSPGDIFIRPLTAVEINHYAKKMEMYNDIWVNGQYKDPSTGEYVPVTLETSIFYMRIYGKSGVIFPNFMFLWTR